MPDPDHPKVEPDSKTAGDVTHDFEASSAAGAVEASPVRIGRYRILRLLGEGGMGAVYEAEQDLPHRTVALKLIRAGYASAEMLRRFENEAQALGRLQHPGIAQIYDAGHEGNQPYFAMELVRGETLLAYCVHRKLHTRQRLELVAKICDAVQHAHQRGLIHRDLKPANIMVEESGQPRILDFGVARLTDSDAQATRETNIGQLVGTLAYMSPEQVLGDPQEIDTRSDVYALGVILYELLAGQGPYKLGPQLPEVVRTIREEEPTSLSSVNRTYRGDIETIVGKALEKDKTRRYASAAELAADIRHYLGNEPITARPPSTTYQLQKFARRNKALVIGVAAVFVVLVAGVVASTWEAVKARRAEAQAKQQSAIAQAVNDFLQNDLLGQASAYNQSKPDPNITVRTVLDQAAQRIQGKFEKQPEVEAAIRNTIGTTYTDLGLYPEAAKQLEAAVDLRRHVLGRERPETLRSMNDLTLVYMDEGSKFPQAEALDNQILETRRRVLGPEHPDTLTSMNNLANVYYHEAKNGQAEALHSQTLEVRRRVLGPENPNTLRSMNDLAIDYADEGKFAQAETLFSQILEIDRHALGPKHPETLRSMSNLANTYEYDGKYAQAEALDKQLLENEPERLDATKTLATVYDDEGKYAPAEALLIRAVEIGRRVFGAEHPETLGSMIHLATVYGEEGKYAQAEALFNHTLDTMRRVLGAEHVGTLDAVSGLASLYQREGKYALAANNAEHALAGLRPALGSEAPDRIAAEADDLALAYVSEGKFAQSEPLAREALETQKKVQPDDWQRYRAASVLGACLAGEKKYAEAEPLLLEGYQGQLARKDRMTAPDQYHLKLAHQWLIRLYQAWGKPDKAVEWKNKPVI